MAKLRDQQDTQHDYVESEFADIVRRIAIEEIRAMIRRLQTTGSFQLPEELRFDELDGKTVKYIRDQLRDTLRTLGGGR